MGVSRFPNGISYILPKLKGASTAQYTFGPGDTTPDVSNGGVFQCSESGTTITTFDGGQKGQIIWVYAHSASLLTIETAGGVTIAPALVANTATGAISESVHGPLTMTSNQVVSFLCTADGSTWSQIDGNYA